MFSTFYLSVDVETTLHEQLKLQRTWLILFAKLPFTLAVFVIFLKI
jgi:hypothetical protein